MWRSVVAVGSSKERSEDQSNRRASMVLSRYGSRALFFIRCALYVKVIHPVVDKCKQTVSVVQNNLGSSTHRRPRFVSPDGPSDSEGSSTDGV